MYKLKSTLKSREECSCYGRDAMAESVEEMTPLKKKLDAFGTFLSKVLHHPSCLPSGIPRQSLVLLARVHENLSAIPAVQVPRQW